MRSMMFKAALAALLISAPMASALARDHEMGPQTQGSPSGGDVTGSQLPISGQPQVHPVGVILTELRNDDARIANDRHMKRISTAEARQLRGEDAALRRTAVSDAGYGGMLSAGTYSQLQSEVSSLDGQISHDAGR